MAYREKNTYGRAILRRRALNISLREMYVDSIHSAAQAVSSLIVFGILLRELQSKKEKGIEIKYKFKWLVK